MRGAEPIPAEIQSDEAEGGAVAASVADAEASSDGLADDDEEGEGDAAAESASVSTASAMSLTSELIHPVSDRWSEGICSVMLMTAILFLAAI